MSMPCLQELLNMMVSKSVLYEPVKDLSDKFPAWLQCNASTTPPADMERYDGCFCDVAGNIRMNRLSAAAAAFM
jgi:hypothetical protein